MKLNFFLYNYNDAEFVTQHKARYQLFLLFFMIAAVTFYFVRNLTVGLVDNSLLFLLGASFPIFVGIIFILRAGFHLVSGHMLISLATFLVWFDSFLQPYQLEYSRLDNIALVLGLIGGAALLTNKKGLVFYFIINATLLFIFWQVASTKFAIEPSILNNYGIDSFIGLAIVTFSALLYTYISEQARKNAEKMNETLEQQVDQRTEQLKSAIAKLDEKNKELEKSQYFMKLDRKLATQVQSHFLKQDLPDFVGWQIATHYQPMAEISGDFYDVYFKENTLQGLALFDVSGHGVASGLVTMLAKKSIYRNFKVWQKKDLGEMLAKTNQELIKDIGDINHYLTGIILRINGNMLEYVNAGHTAVIKKEVGQGAHVVADENYSNHGPYLGIPGVQMSFPVKSIAMHPGDTALLFTDALSESLGGLEESMHLNQVCEIFSDINSTLPCQEQINQLLETVIHKRDQKPLDDDLTIMLLKRAN